MSRFLGVVSKSIMKKNVFWLLLFLLLWISIELFSWLGLVILKNVKSLAHKPFSSSFLTLEQEEIIQKLLSNQQTYLSHHPILGWSIQPNGRNNEFSANSYGIRADREYSLEPSPNKIRISTFGDSFTHGDEVATEATWQAYIEKINPHFEVLNFGVGGYGLDQSYLRHKLAGAQFNPQIVFIGYMIEDVERTVNTFRPFYAEGSQIPLTKPRFILENDQLILIDNPLPKLEDYVKLLNKDKATLAKIGKYDFYYNKKYYKGPFDFLPSVRFFKISKRQYQELTNERAREEAFRIDEKIFQEFCDSITKHGARPIIIIFPTEWDLYQKKNHNPIRYKNILEMLERNGFEYIDLLNAFNIDGNKYQIEELFSPWKHYSAFANQIVAEYIVQYLKKTGTH